MTSPSPSPPPPPPSAATLLYSRRSRLKKFAHESRLCRNPFGSGGGRRNLAFRRATGHFILSTYAPRGRRSGEIPSCSIYLEGKKTKESLLRDDQSKRTDTALVGENTQTRFRRREAGTKYELEVEGYPFRGRVTNCTKYKGRDWWRLSSSSKLNEKNGWRMIWARVYGRMNIGSTVDFKLPEIITNEVVLRGGLGVVVAIQ
ncbi:hypothetical protein K438DRAFT_1932489 [Mycena galopus ATCC 62051]|nr:hypothetical protein K438DRAFT_1932489 [Mycena galopus ATCC 62051]